ncbi:hypothetical protein Psed_4872 [Pseudonocardia dioxanivorans CB1190]|uniref:Uncharacterized protein n=1 Tax=Pseudonocardia dioxanivorans (strain ATCC 55486 / DSM 44775 / JCM 13855 / CB1190) TaxID=675635 RepID=F4CJZ1_PSEUX|nr:hypothetical protein Psed_4872 [Pseudonocardia dioxanivorans CB1190]
MKTTGRPRLHEIGMSPGTQTRLKHVLHEHGLRNGNALSLHHDRGSEHGPRDFAANPATSDPPYVLRLAVEWGVTGIVMRVGLAQKSAWEDAGAGPVPAIRRAAPRDPRHVLRRHDLMRPTPKPARPGCGASLPTAT